MVDDQPLTPAVFALLLALHKGERHGYALMADVAELTGGTVVLGPATLYRSLQRMRVDGLVEEIATEAESMRADRRAERRRSYRVTAAGRAAAEAEARRLARLVDAAADLGVLRVAKTERTTRD
ncbi:MAG TPA: PadR family transcriptional regulator [Actinophytocola sp.]|uniref:PadR family transcriptional regulator n=1 Tax=Actinophytocola sp. TaxID=1872138 RepID=UPI002DDD1280|nr:PadR family transcriptional regulator [Actinophytocola sp.]HEV2779826.1 PadR family transcriptional regulator [Actinophytocola sp.]